MSFFYGDIDWMTNVGTHDVLASNPYLGTYSHYYTVKNSDHHLYFDNHKEFVELIFKDLENLNEIGTINQKRGEIIEIKKEGEQ